MDPIVHNNQHAAPFRLGVSSNGNSVVEVERTIRADGCRWAHRAYHHDWLIRLHREVEEESGFLHGVSPMRDHDTVNVVRLCELVDSLRDLKHDLKAHVLRAD